MQALVDKHKDRVIDLLTERLTFERAGVRLYDAILGKMRHSDDEAIGRMISQMQEHRDQEKEHEEWLEEQIRALGGDAHAMTDRARLVEVESEGLEKVILDGDPEIPHLFHALLAAELSDGAGWDLLVQLARRAGDDQAAEEFSLRLDDEREHLVFVRRAVESFARRDLLDEEVRMPDAP